MPYSKRTPPLKIKMDIKNFNFLIEILSIHIERDDEILSKKSSKLKDKLLRYSVPIETVENETVIDSRLYPNEAEDLIYILFNSIDEWEVATNYYEVLVKVRETLKKNDIEE